MSEVLEDYALSKNKKEKQKKGTIQKVGVIGCGTMGQEITRTISKAGIEVTFIDVDTERVDEIKKNISNQLDEIINKWGLTQGEKRAIMARIKGSADYKDLGDCDIIIETIHTKKRGTSLELRREIFHNVEKYIKEDAIITSNVSTLNISDLAEVLQKPERAIGLHFMNPASTVKVVEVARGNQTNDYSYEMICKFAKMIGKNVITVNESPGNISTRLIVTLINEACEILMEGVASVKSVDETMKQGSGLQFGPFEMADKIGLDKLLKWMENMFQEFGDKKYKASPVLKRLVRANYLGRKTQKGFYIYEDDEATDQTLTCTEIK